MRFGLQSSATSQYAMSSIQSSRSSSLVSLIRVKDRECHRDLSDVNTTRELALL